MASTLSDKTNITTVSTTQIKTGSGILKRIVVNDIGTTWVIKVYDAASGTTNIFADIVPTVTGTLEFGIKFQVGLRVITTGTPGDITVVWE